MKNLKRILIALTALFSVSAANAQLCDTFATICGKHLPAEYISDGQVYRALLVDDQTASFQTTFFAGSTYRIAAQSGFDDGNLTFAIYDNDEERHELFNSVDFKNAPYWDFEVESTIDITIEAQLDINRVASGCAVLLIGFKKNDAQNN